MNIEGIIWKRKRNWFYSKLSNYFFWVEAGQSQEVSGDHELCGFHTSCHPIVMRKFCPMRCKLIS